MRPIDSGLLLLARFLPRAHNRSDSCSITVAEAYNIWILWDRCHVPHSFRNYRPRLSPHIRSTVQTCDNFNTLEPHHMSFSPPPSCFLSNTSNSPIPFSVQVPFNQVYLECLHESPERNHKRRPIRLIPHYKRAPAIANSQPLATINIYEYPSLTCFSSWIGDSPRFPEPGLGFTGTRRLKWWVATPAGEALSDPLIFTAPRKATKTMNPGNPWPKIQKLAYQMRRGKYPPQFAKEKWLSLSCKWNWRWRWGLSKLGIWWTMQSYYVSGVIFGMTNYLRPQPMNSPSKSVRCG